MKKLTQEEVQKKIKTAGLWQLDPKHLAIQKDFKFENFTDAVCFLNKVAEIAEEEDHHPDFHLTNYKFLKIVLSTHAAGGLTNRDFLVAHKIDEVAA